MSRVRLSPNDTLALVGLVLLTVGAALAWLPAGFIVPGALLLAYAILPDRSEPSA